MDCQACGFSHCPHNPCNEDEQGQLGWHGVGMTAVISRAKTDCRKTSFFSSMKPVFTEPLGTPHIFMLFPGAMARFLNPGKGNYVFISSPLHPGLRLGEISRSFIHCLKRLTHISMPGRVHQAHLCSDIRQWRGPARDAVTDSRWKCRQTVEMNLTCACF